MKRIRNPVDWWILDCRVTPELAIRLHDICSSNCPEACGTYAGAAGAVESGLCGGQQKGLATIEGGFGRLP